jgi:lipoic acid synthetase
MSEKIEVEKKYTKELDWLLIKLPTGKEYAEVRQIVSEYKLHTICQSGSCPTMG